MAQSHNTFFLVLTLALLISMAKSTNLIGFGKHRAPAVTCNDVHGTDSGESCATVAQEFGLSLQDFLLINPNINCTAVFVGQWLCVDGTTS